MSLHRWVGGSKSLKTPLRNIKIAPNKQQSQAQSDQCKMEMAFRLARWHWEFLGTAWSNKSDANPPEGDTKPPEGNNP